MRMKGLGPNVELGAVSEQFWKRFLERKRFRGIPIEICGSPTVNKGVTEVDCTDCDSRKAGHSSTKKLLMEEHEKKEQIVWIPKLALRWTPGLGTSQLSYA